MAEASHTHEGVGWDKDKIRHTHPGGYYHPHYHRLNGEPMFYCKCRPSFKVPPPGTDCPDVTTNEDD